MDRGLKLSDTCMLKICFWQARAVSTSLLTTPMPTHWNHSERLHSVCCGYCFDSRPQRNVTTLNKHDDTGSQPPTTAINQNYTTCTPGPFKTPSLWTQYVRLGTPKYRTHVCVCLRMRIIQGRAWMILLYYKRSVMKYMYTVFLYTLTVYMYSVYISLQLKHSVKPITVIVETCKQYCDVTYRRSHDFCFKAKAMRRRRRNVSSTTTHYVKHERC